MSDVIFSHLKKRTERHIRNALFQAITGRGQPVWKSSQGLLLEPDWTQFLPSFFKTSAHKMVCKWITIATKKQRCSSLCWLV